MKRATGVRATQPLPEEDGGSSPTVALLRKHEWIVRPCSFRLAKKLVRKWHYASGGSNTRVYCFGLWRRDESFDRDCYGISWWIPTLKDGGSKILPENPQGVLVLSRLVVVPTAPKNACSFLIRHSMRFIDRKRWPVLVTYADEWQGHDGGIYKAVADAGWKEDGWTIPQGTYVKDGRTISRRSHDRTYRHEEMLAMGCKFLGKFRKKRFVHRIVK